MDSVRSIGLSLGADICWPACYEAIVRDLDLKLEMNGERIRFDIERISIEPFDLRQPSKYDVVIDRLTHWYHLSREWIKKAILLDDLYVFNNPWSLQSMEKHTSYCAMIRLGMPIPAHVDAPAEVVQSDAGPQPHAAPIRAPVRPRRSRETPWVIRCFSSRTTAAVGGPWQKGEFRGRTSSSLRGKRHRGDARSSRGACPTTVSCGVLGLAPRFEWFAMSLKPASARPIYERHRLSSAREQVEHLRKDDAHDQFVLRMGVQ